MQIKVGNSPTEEELFNEIIKYDFWHALFLIGDASIKVYKNPDQYQDRILNSWTLSRIACYFVKYGSIFGRRKMNLDDLIKINNMIINLYEPVLQDNDVWALFHRVVREQFSYQYGYGEQIARYYWIFTQTKFLEEMKIEFERLNKFNLYTYYLIFFYVIGNGINKESSHFEYQSLLDDCSEWQSQYDFLEVQKIEDFFCFISNSLENIRDEGKRINEDLSSEYLKYEISPLDIYPVISQFLGKKLCFIPSFESLQTKMSTGLYYYFQNLYNEGDKKNLFLTQIGYAFEDYIGWLLKKYFGSQNVKKVSEEIQTNGQEQADWLVFIDDEIFVFECKARLLSAKGRQTYEAKYLEPFLNETIVKGCSQLETTEQKLREKYSQKSITKIFVILDDFWFQKDSFDGLLEKVNIKDEQFNEVIMTTARGIERLDSVLETRTMKQICCLKKSTEAYKKMDFMNFLHKITNQSQSKNKYLNEIINDFTPKEKNLPPSAVIAQ